MNTNTAVHNWTQGSTNYPIKNVRTKQFIKIRDIKMVNMCGRIIEAVFVVVQNHNRHYQGNSFHRNYCFLT